MTQRIVWADATLEKLRDVRSQINELHRQERDIKAQCNHTYSTGKSALKTWVDNAFEPSGTTTGTTCSVCDTEL